MGWNARFVLLAATLLALAPPATGFPEYIPPQPLWAQVGRAELVVVAEVESQERIRVREVWKGEAEVGAVLPVVQETTMCPAPGVFLRGETVLAFLGRISPFTGAADGAWHATEGNWGTIYTDDAGLAQFRALVREALQLQRRGRVTVEEKFAWLLRAAAHRATRWHGLLELARADGTSGVRPEWSLGFLRGPRPAPQDREELVRAFIAEPGPEGLRLLLPLVESVRSTAFDAALVHGLDLAAEEPGLVHGLEDALSPVARWFGVALPVLPDRPWSLATEERRAAFRDAWLELRARITARR